MMIASEQKRIQNLEGLSEVIIETLKSLRSENEPLSISFLSKALGKRDEVLDMLSGGGGAAGEENQPFVGASAEEKGGNFDLPGPAKIADHDLRLKVAVEEQEQILRMKDYLRRSTATLISLIEPNGWGDGLSLGLSAYRKVVHEGTGIEALEEGLQKLKNSITSLPAFPEPAPDHRISDIAAKTQLMQPLAGKGAGESFVLKLKSMFMNIVAEFDQDLGEDYAKRIARFRRSIQSGTAPDDLAALEVELLELVQTYNRSMNEDRNQITDFISEIGNSLIEIEQQFLNSMTQSGLSKSENHSLNTLIESHIEEMKKSAQISTTLAEFKGLVVSRLASIREALAQKRRAEELREETIQAEMQNLQQSLARMKKEVDQVQEKRKALEKEILIDQLTGIANRRAAKRRIKDEIQRYHRYQQYFSVLLFDIDHFKSVNDRFGHWAGDKCLKELIKRIRPMLRETDFLARWGGEEFIILFPGTEIENAFGVAERLRRAIENTRLVYNRQEIAVTASIGVTEVNQSDVTLESIFNRTDKAMYEAKKKGRNQVVRV